MKFTDKQKEALAEKETVQAVLELMEKVSEAEGQKALKLDLQDKQRLLDAVARYHGMKDLIGHVRNLTSAKRA